MSGSSSCRIPFIFLYRPSHGARRQNQLVDRGRQHLRLLIVIKRASVIKCAKPIRYADLVWHDRHANIAQHHAQRNKAPQTAQSARGDRPKGRDLAMVSSKRRLILGMRTRIPIQRIFKQRRDGTVILRRGHEQPVHEQPVMVDKELFQPLSAFRQASLCFDITIVDWHIKIVEVDQGDLDICVSGNARSQGCELIVCRRGPRASGNINSLGMNPAFWLMQRVRIRPSSSAEYSHRSPAVCAKRKDHFHERRPRGQEAPATTGIPSRHLPR